MNRTIQHAAIRLIAFVLLVITTPCFSATAQTHFDFDHPEGTYIITDYMNHKITLRLKKATSYAYCVTKGPATITINGRTLPGTWRRFDDDPYIVFETYDNVEMHYYMPSGSGYIDQIIISDDGRASYNTSELMKDNGDWIKAKRVSSNAGKKSKKRKK